MRLINKTALLFAALVLGTIFSGCNESAWDKHVGGSETFEGTLMEAIDDDPDLSVFAQLLRQTGYDNLLAASGSYTVFAPVNSAWSTVDTSDENQLVKIIGSMIVYKTFFSDNPELFEAITSLNGKNIFYNPETKTFNGASITRGDIEAANGALQVTDKVLERKDNIWEFLSTKTTSNQFIYINSLNTQVMDEEKSIALGVNEEGLIRYDTVWMQVNSFLDSYPIHREDSIFTYIIVENTGFDMLYNKYKPYLNLGSANAAELYSSDSITRFNICQDFVFKGIHDITTVDSLENVDGMMVPVKDVQINEVYNASNGRVYVINQSNIPLREKIKPIKIEGEDFIRAHDAYYVFTRYKRWASGERDVVLSSGATQEDSLWRKVPLAPDSVVRKDSVASRTYYINSGLVANVANFFIEYKAQVKSANYDIYYVAYDDIASHFDHSYTDYGVYKVTQKLFASMPGSEPLRRGSANSSAEVVNNYLGATRCFVGEGLAGYHELTKLVQRDLVVTTQIIDQEKTDPLPDVMTVPRTGEMTLWLTNTAVTNQASRQGLLFLDYLLLVPRITEE